MKKEIHMESDDVADGALGARKPPRGRGCLRKLIIAGIFFVCWYAYAFGPPGAMTVRDVRSEIEANLDPGVSTVQDIELFLESSDMISSFHKTRWTQEIRDRSGFEEEGRFLASVSHNVRRAACFEQSINVRLFFDEQDMYTHHRVRTHLSVPLP